jgi:hypothetical protein
MAWMTGKTRGVAKRLEQDRLIKGDVDTRRDRVIYAVRDLILIE